jgi:glycosyltransferase involved in cell wall biosynthesis
VSTDDTVSISKHVKNLQIIRNTENKGFLRNCNNGAGRAKGKYIFILNNDTQVQPQWLSSLVALIKTDPNIGMVGSKLIAPDGTLQEAGGILWCDGSAWNFGRNDDPNLPAYNYAKEVDYISGAAIMICKKLWDKISGFDERYIPAYYEDTDLAFEVRRHGYKVVLQPKSIVVHFEGKSNGTSLDKGLKHYQTVNHKKFFEKWKSILERDHFPNAQNVFHARDRSKNKRTMVVVDHYVPWFDQDAGSRSTYMYLKLFVENGYNVKFIGDNFFPHQPYTDTLNDMGIEVLHGEYFAKNWEQWVVENKNYIDVVYLHRPHIAPKYLDFFRANTAAKIVYQCHDLHYKRLFSDYKNSGDEALLAESENWEKTEIDIFSKADVGVTFSIDEKRELEEKLPNARIYQIPLFLYDKEEVNTAPFSERSNIMFVGGFNHKPNGEGIVWFTEKVFPLVLKKLPNTRLTIAGSGPPDYITKLESRNISILGYISDEKLYDLYFSSKINILPLRHGGGVKGKLIESMQTGTPLVSTSVGMQGVNTREFGLNAFDDYNAFANELIKLLTDEKYWLKNQAALKLAFRKNFCKNTFALKCSEIF